MGDDLPARVADVVRRHASGVSKALLFGSVTRGEAGPDSDIDLVLVWPADTDESARWDASTDIAVRMTRFTGNPCIPLVYTESEYADLPRRAPAFAKSLARDGIDLLECGE